MGIHWKTYQGSISFTGSEVTWGKLRLNSFFSTSLKIANISIETTFHIRQVTCDAKTNPRSIRNYIRSKLISAR